MGLSYESGVRVVVGEIPSSFRFIPTDFPDGRLAVDGPGREGHPCTVTITGANAARARINGEPIIPGAAYPLTKRLVIEATDVVDVDIRPAQPAPWLDRPEGRS